VSGGAPRGASDADALEDGVALLRTALRERSGLSGDSISDDRLRGELASAMRRTGAAAVEAAGSVIRDRDAFAALEAAFAPPETWLFRYPASFELVRRLASGWRGERVRAVVAGAGGWCEPCALAAALLEGTAGRAKVEVLAIDRNPTVFEAGPRFAGLALRGEVPSWAARHFEREGEGLRPGSAVVDAITTRVADLRDFVRDPGAWRDLQVVAFRNVAIYLDPHVRAAAFAGLATIVAGDGVLLVGHAEVHVAREHARLEPDPAEGAFALRGPSRPAAACTELPSVASMDRIVPSMPRMDVSGASSSARTFRGGPPTTPTAPAAPSARSAPLAHAPCDPPPAAPTADACVAEALALEQAGEAALAARAVGRALYLDRRHEGALMLAARLADARGDVAEADRLRARALRVHLERADDPSPDADAR
jgi:chemotaxis methyl-accepting protein methylase